jgi:hypothetical protein
MGLVSPATSLLKKCYHHTFEIKENGKTIVRHTLVQNPQSFTQVEPPRSGVTQTLGGAYIVDYGSGLPSISISGTTGYKLRYNDDGELRDGYQEFKHLRNEIYRKFIETNSPDYELYWYNWEDEEYYKIQPTTQFKLQRSSSEPVLYRYDFSFTGLCRATIATNIIADKIMVLPDIYALTNSLIASASSINEILANFA